MPDSNKPATIYPSLAGKSVFITGGGTGIGEVMVTRFCEQGAKVTFVDIAQQASSALCQKLAGRYRYDPRFIFCDLRDIEALKQAIEQTREIQGDIGVLINNAADDTRHAADKMDVSYWEDKFAVNLRPCFFSVQAVVPQMKRLGGGSVINMGSVSWRVKQTGMPAYTTAKAGIEGLTRSLAASYGKDNIRVNTLVPGWVMTERQITHWLTPEMIEDVRLSQCINETIKPDDIVNAALFLAADDSRMVTAQSLIVDAGWT
ncbi:SDR family NAD(P)-dependent oxidoreductase [Pseudoalteromonas mariniglutinosa]|uniref:SDR family NAD(P)-dependent oxidoreductase n=1 Tax=Pseudoalteromonas mariniglutinosa TaxID=206042 RepID=UPI0038513492